MTNTRTPWTLTTEIWRVRLMLASLYVKRSWLKAKLRVILAVARALPGGAA